jgi:hypothetical protein
MDIIRPLNEIVGRLYEHGAANYFMSLRAQVAKQSPNE